jgi:hypothetical protein
MSIRCTYCGRDYDTTLFEFNRSITCVCGKTVTFKHEQMTDEALLARMSEDRKVRKTKKPSVKLEVDFFHCSPTL